MNRQEAASVVAYLNRAGLLGAMEGQAAVWADALADVSYVTAQEVVREMARNRTSDQRWVTPGDVAAAVTTTRAANQARVPLRPAPPETIEADDTARQIAWRRAFDRLVGDGLDADEADAAACAEVGATRPPAITAARPVAQLVAQTAASLPRIPRGAA